MNEYNFLKNILKINSDVTTRLIIQLLPILSREKYHVKVSVPTKPN